MSNMFFDAPKFRSSIFSSELPQEDIDQQLAEYDYYEQYDSTKDYKLKTSLVKSITGGDTISVRDLYKSNIEYKPLFSVVLLCNKKPAIDRVDKAMEERLKVIHYPFMNITVRRIY